MKKWTQALMLSAAAAALVFSSCGDKKETSRDGSGTISREITITPQQMQELGFISQLPSDTQWVTTIYKPRDIWQKLRNSDFGKAVMHYSGITDAADGTASVTPQEQLIINCLGDEMTFAQYGDVPDAISKLSRIYTEINKIKFNFTENDLSQNKGDMLRNIASNIDIPPTWIALKNDENSFQLIQSLIETKSKDIADDKDFIEPLEYTLADLEFKGIIIDLTKAAVKIPALALSNEEQNELSNNPELAKKIVILAGRKGDYTLIFAGKDTTDLRFAPTVEESVAAAKDFQFINNYTNITPATLTVISEVTVKALMDYLQEYNKGNYNSIKEMLNIVNAMGGLIGENNNGIEEPVDRIIDKLSAVSSYAYGGASAIKTISWFEPGGYNIDTLISKEWAARTIDIEKDLMFASISQKPDNILIYESNSSKDYHAVTLDLFHEIGKSSMQILDTVASSPSMNDNPMIAMIYGQIKTQLINVGNSLDSIVTDGLGRDMAFSIDIAPNRNEMPVDISFLIETSNKEIVKTGYDEITQEVKKLGTMLLGQQWNNFAPDLTVDVLTLGSEQIARYSLSPVGDLYDIAPAILIGDKRTIVSTSGESAESLAKSLTDSSSVTNHKGYYCSLNISALAKMLEPVMDDMDLQEYKPVLKALSSDLKTINANMTVEGDEVKNTMRFITE